MAYQQAHGPLQKNAFSAEAVKHYCKYSKKCIVSPSRKIFLGK